MRSERQDRCPQGIALLLPNYCPTDFSMAALKYILNPRYKPKTQDGAPIGSAFSISLKGLTGQRLRPQI
jgi:hypothetical protein